MRKRSLMLLFMMVFVFIYFSPLEVGATEGDSTSDLDGETVVESPEKVIEEEVDTVDKDKADESSENKVDVHTKKDESQGMTEPEIGEPTKTEEVPANDQNRNQEDSQDSESLKVKAQNLSKTPETLEFDMEHPGISALKEKLNAIGFDGIKITDYFGGWTETRVKQFQSFVGLQANGIVDANTRDKLDDLLENGYQQGDRHSSIIDLKEKLNKTSFGGITVTDYYGSFTEQRVSEFQEDNGLEVTGRANIATLNKLDEILANTLRLGDRDEAIADIKVKLNAIGFDGIKVTNNFGNWTETRLKQFQDNYGLEVTGVLDATTTNKINNVYKSPLQVGNRHDEIIPLKEKLNRMGFDNIRVTRNFGNWTQTRLKQFQRFVGLEDNGIADSYTLAKLDEFMEYGYEKGDRHQSIVDLKNKLNKTRFGGIKVTEYYGNWTATRVKQFQEAYGLSATGRANAATLNKLDEVLQNILKKGDRKDAIIPLKEKLNAIGFDGIKVTNYYGNWTATRVKQFQENYGLKATGIANPVTLEKLDKVYNNPFQHGKRHDNTIELKNKLNEIGFGYITVTTLYGSFTEKQVKKFQDHYGLAVTGIADDPTIEKINAIYSSPFQKGKRHKDTIQLKKNLNKIGYGGIKVTNYYGDFMQKRVKQFQRDHELPISGIADSITRKKIEDSIIKVFIDPGHGDHDPGAQGYGINEKDIVLDIALRAADVLSSDYYAVDVKLSRTTDKFVELEDRAHMANSWGADYFVSVHNNSFNGSASGFESYIYNGGVSSITKQRQRDMHQYLIRKLGVNDRGMKSANFNVLRNSTMPAILLEYLFIDNSTENALLKRASYRNWLGEITADAIANSFNIKKR
ncbi:peptidoglycan-binding protein [Oceanobacillus halotolerans]|uniref:peptidoglycan-binding protein n=1 Tax=Oceanobacillus halotolerans TaxID=2663380 RepID=UPI0013DB354C|nr:peptidoglycan-binding protein [Oceanobacillus halotolerans]